MLKISQIGKANHSVTLRLEGRIVGPWVAELRESCEQVLKMGQALKLHLEDVEFMDSSGVALLAELGSRSVRFIDSPPFVMEQLKTIQCH